MQNSHQAKAAVKSVALIALMLDLHSFNAFSNEKVQRKAGGKS